MNLTDSPEGLYVQDVTAKWSTATYTIPYITSWSSPGFHADPFDVEDVGVQSNVNIVSSGGSIAIYPTEAAVVDTDAELNVTLNYALRGPHGSGSSFEYNSATGGGTLTASLSEYYNPDTGLYDADSDLTFSISSVTQVGEAPEPATWTMMLTGFGMAGGAFRGWRHRMNSRSIV